MGSVAAVSRRGNGESKENPRNHVVERCGGHGGLSNSRGEELELCQNAREDRESGYGERNADEHHQGDVTDFILAAHDFPQHEGDPDAGDERDRYPGGGNGEGLPPAPANRGQIQLEANEEEEEQETDARYRFEYRSAPRGENPVRILRVSPQSRWTEKNPALHVKT